MTRPSPLGGYSTREVASLLGLSLAQIRSYARAGFVAPQSGARGELLFSFQDLILLRTAKALLAARIPRRRIRMALKNLHEQLAGRPLTGVRISALGSQVVARDGDEAWNAESGQTLLDFETSELAREASRLARRQVLVELERERRPRSAEGSAAGEAEERFEGGLEHEDRGEIAEALAAYAAVLELAPGHVEAHLNLGRLLHERGEPAAAERHYRQALAADPRQTTASYNLGVALQDLGRLREAVAAYEATLALEPTYADAHYNLAGVYEALGDRAAAFRHLRTYRTLLETGE
jgi:tetratricopeptide (TPR) repeat protein